MHAIRPAVAPILHVSVVSSKVFCRTNLIESKVASEQYLIELLGKVLKHSNDL